MLLTGPTTCIIIALFGSSITNLCFAQPLDANNTIVEKSKHLIVKEGAKPILPIKGIFTSCFISYFEVVFKFQDYSISVLYFQFPFYRQNCIRLGSSLNK